MPTPHLGYKDEAPKALRMTTKKKVEIDAEHVDITSAEPPEGPRQSPIEELAALKAEAMADKIVAAAEKLAAVKLASDDKLAAERVAAEERRDRREFALKILLGFPAVLAAVGAFISVWRIGDVGHSVNSMKDELVAEVKKTSHAEGVAEGKADKGK